MPLLSIYAEDDYVVPPEVNVRLLRNLLEEAGNTDFEIVVLAEANHSIAFPSGFVGEGDWPDRYYQPWTRSPDLIPTILDWLRSRLDLDGPVGER